MNWCRDSKAWGCPLKAKRSIRPRRRGYVSLLAITFGFGLAALGTAVAVSARAYIAATVRQERMILDRMTLESASIVVVAQYATGQKGELNEVSKVELNGRTVRVEISSPWTKLDPQMDSAETIAASLTQLGIGRELRQTPEASLVALAKSLGLGADGEDCLRHGITLGRAPAGLMTRDAVAAVQGVTSGDQLDIRASIRREAQEQVLWQRVRFTGSPLSPWKTHDYRWLQVTGDACPGLDRR